MTLTVTPTMFSDLLGARSAVLVADDADTLEVLDALSDELANDPWCIVLAEHRDAQAYLRAERLAAGPKTQLRTLHARAAKALTADLTAPLVSFPAQVA